MVSVATGFLHPAEPQAPLLAGYSAGSSSVHPQTPLPAECPADCANCIADLPTAPVVSLYLTVHPVPRTRGSQGTS